MEKNRKTNPHPAVRVILALALLAVLVVLGLWAGTRTFRQAPRLTRTDLPGFAYVKLSDHEGSIIPENHCTAESGVTVVDDKGRGWRVQAPGWNLQWVMTNSLGAWIDAKNLETGRTENFYLGSNADMFEICPLPVGDDLKVDAMSDWHRFLGWSWQTPRWELSGFRAFVDSLTVEPIARQEVGQTVALGDNLDLRQDGAFCGQPLWVGEEPTEPYVILWYDPFFFEEEPRTASYTSTTGLTWTLQWFEPVAEEESHVYAESEGNRVEVILPGAETADSRQMLARAQAVLDRISAREA